MARALAVQVEDMGTPVERGVAELVVHGRVRYFLSFLSLSLLSLSSFLSLLDSLDPSDGADS